MPRPSRRRAVAALLVVLATVVVVLPDPAGAAAGPPAGSATTAYRPPVAGPIVSGFALPAERWQPGNRGVDYAPEPGTPVTAAADGEVVFAGEVGGELHVTVRHPDGLRTSYSFLASVSVAVGQRVRAGDPVGVAGGPFHFGVREPDGTYLDPAALLAGILQPRPVLVPGTAEGADPLVERRSLLETFIDTGVASAAALARAAGGAALDAAGWAADQLASALQGDCTAPGVEPPPPPERRIAVLVSGLGTSSDGNSAFEIDTRQLGYAGDDVVRFSYTAGRSPDDGNPYVAGDPGLAGIEVQEFDGRATQVPLEVSADRLTVLLEEIHRREPGVPVDVLAHSQGGVVARLALDRAGQEGTLPAEVENLVTLGSPHRGADAADAVAELRSTHTGTVATNVIAGEWFDPLDPNLPSIPQLTSSGGPLAEVRDRPLPAGVRFTSIGGRWDGIVPGLRTADDAADRQVIVDVGSPMDPMGVHEQLTEDPRVTREVALALRGLPPTCEALLEMAADRIGPVVTAGAERSVGHALTGIAVVSDAASAATGR